VCGCLKSAKLLAVRVIETVEVERVRQRIVLLVTALGLLIYFVNMVLHPPLALYQIRSVWTVLGVLVFLALFPSRGKD
jgi:hypothetical protein